MDYIHWFGIRLERNKWRPWPTSNDPRKRCIDRNQSKNVWCNHVLVGEPFISVSVIYDHSLPFSSILLQTGKYSRNLVSWKNSIIYRFIFGFNHLGGVLAELKSFGFDGHEQPNNNRFHWIELNWNWTNWYELTHLEDKRNLSFGSAIVGLRRVSAFVLQGAETEKCGWRAFAMDSRPAIQICLSRSDYRSTSSNRLGYLEEWLPRFPFSEKHFFFEQLSEAQPFSKVDSNSVSMGRNVEYSGWRLVPMCSCMFKLGGESPEATNQKPPNIRRDSYRVIIWIIYLFSIKFRYICSRFVFLCLLIFKNNEFHG